MLDAHFGRPTHSRSSSSFLAHTRTPPASTARLAPPEACTAVTSTKELEDKKPRSIAVSQAQSNSAQKTPVSQVRMRGTSFVSAEPLQRPSSRLGVSQHAKSRSNISNSSYTTPPEYPSSLASQETKTQEPSNKSTAQDLPRVRLDSPFAYTQGIPARARIGHATPVSDYSTATRSKSRFRSKSPPLAVQIVSHLAPNRNGASGFQAPSTHLTEYLDKYKSIKGPSIAMPSRRAGETMQPYKEGNGGVTDCSAGSSVTTSKGEGLERPTSRTGDESVAGDSFKRKYRPRGGGTTYGDPTAEAEIQVSAKRLSLQSELKRLFGR